MHYFRAGKIFVLCCLVGAILTESTPFGFNEALENVRKVYPRLSEQESRIVVNLMQKRLELLHKTGEISKWKSDRRVLTQCPPLSPPPSTDNIDSLRPGNVKIVASMGDSITAGFAADSSSLIGVKEWRGLSWSIGGDDGAVTFPVTEFEFSPDLYGASLGTGDREDNSQNFLNGAVSGAIVQDMPDQANWLVQHLKALNGSSFQDDWKVVTIWIGGNNLCDVCNDPSKHSADEYEKYLGQALSILYQIPRTFVNLVPSLDITELSRYSSGICRFLHPFECRCATSSQANQELVVETNRLYTERIYKLSTQWNNQASNDTRQDWAAVVQPFLIKTQIPDESYLSSADCFHPSVKAHQAAAVALWNSMTLPSSKKVFQWVPGEPIVCPTQDTLFYVV